MTKYLMALLLAFMPSCIMGQRNIRKFDIRNGLSSNYVNGIAQDKYGYLWLATEEGLTSLDGTEFRPFSPTACQFGSKEVPLNEVYSDAKEPIVWVGSQRDGLYANNVETEQLTRYVNNPRDAKSIATNDITAIAPAADSAKLWIGTF